MKDPRWNQNMVSSKKDQNQLDMETGKIRESVLISELLSFTAFFVEHLTKPIDLLVLIIIFWIRLP